MAGLLPSDFPNSATLGGQDLRGFENYRVLKATDGLFERIANEGEFVQLANMDLNGNDLNNAGDVNCVNLNASGQADAGSLLVQGPSQLDADVTFPNNSDIIGAGNIGCLECTCVQDINAANAQISGDVNCVGLIASNDVQTPALDCSGAITQTAAVNNPFTGSISCASMAVTGIASCSELQSSNVNIQARNDVGLVEAAVIPAVVVLAGRKGRVNWEEVGGGNITIAAGAARDIDVQFSDMDQAFPNLDDLYIKVYGLGVGELKAFVTLYTPPDRAIIRLYNAGAAPYNGTVLMKWNIL